MKTVSRAVNLGLLHQHLRSCGFDVAEVEDPAKVLDLTQNIGKPYLTPFSSPEHNDFTQKTALWLVGWQGDEPAFMGCARLEDLGGEGISSYWRRSFARAYGGVRAGPVIRGVRRDIERGFSGRVVYFGDLFVNPKVRGSRKALRSFVALGHLSVSLKWDPDWTYCFVRERDVLRGASANYGFTQVYPSPFEWVDEPPAPRDRSEWLATLPRQSLDESVEAVVRTISKDLPLGHK